MNQISTDLKLKVQDVILTNPQTKEHGIEVFDKNGVVTLKGSVPTQEVSRIAETVVKEIDDVVSVINMLNIQPVTEITINTLGIKK